MMGGDGEEKARDDKVKEKKKERKQDKRKEIKKDSMYLLYKS